MPTLIDIFLGWDFWGCLLLGYPLNIILIILIIFKTPKEMETHSRILIQNCVLDILMLTLQMLIQGVKTLKGPELNLNKIIFFLKKTLINKSYYSKAAGL
ncbi:unnamed protein product [Meloidogyne enterolobii]|uniref:Uncharacterized protein n=1 Tax=Meloidogyne enterolobii TaxID=390850 RepID=A0ACB0ZEV4_MELEN